ncbi:hypothetical protein M422DRAFT_124487, partial [Sphaerobolus stellatus SS14]
RLKTTTFLLFASIVHATVNGPCTVGTTPGVCISTSICTSGRGTYASGYCPNDASDIKCRYK